VPDTARGAVDQHLAAEEEPALAQRMQGRQPGDRQRRGLCVGHGVGKGGDGMAWRAHPLGPGAGREEADHAAAGRGAAAVGGALLDNPGEIPTRAIAEVALRGCASNLAAVQ
jgi:hypothetical protein